MFTIFGAVVELVELNKEEIKLIAQKRVAQGAQIESNGQQRVNVDDLKQKQKEINEKKLLQVLTVIRAAGDTITSTSMLGWDEKYFGSKFSDSWIGFGGFTSGAIMCYLSYPKAK